MKLLNILMRHVLKALSLGVVVVLSKKIALVAQVKHFLGYNIC